ncbi:MAG TPA: 3,4-dihydroxy-2-butanone-4-phosphate synthase [Candidatus Bilamarchaeum sp.]|nr:3,4-dihydroxy-2-butanone-4-phosphate synthase [Candidatus Bilamarchaeum sp.]
MSVDKAVAQLRKGGIIVVYDGDEREGEADMILSARFAKPEIIEKLRKDAGGLICAAINKDAAESIGLPFFTDLLEDSGVTLKAISCRKTAYGDKPAFSLPINHCKVFTGITDDDRALTMTMLDEVVRVRIADFKKEFYSPGHVFLLIGRGLERRRGHTELALELGKRAGLGGAMVLCEMLGSGKALPKGKAKEYAKRNGFAFVEGRDVVAGME